MKIAIFILILALLLAPAIQAKTVTENLKVLESLEIKNQNITLLKLDNKEDKVIVCVNGLKAIIPEHEEKTVNNVLVEVKDIKNDYAKIRVKSSCNDCTLNNNNNCLNECNSNSDCNDNNELTEDKCTGTPKKCVFTETPKTEEKKEPEKTSQTITVNKKQPETPEKTPEKPNFFTKFLNWISNLFSKQ